MKKKIKVNQDQVSEILRSPGLWDRIVLDELGKKIAGEEKAREIIFLCAMGRLVKNASFSSFNLLIHSKSSAGKDFVLNNVLGILPFEEIFKKTRISEKVLNYWEPFKRRERESWDGSILYLIDIGETILNSEAMKVMCSEGSSITIMEKVVGKYEAVDKEIKGKPVVMATTATAFPTEEILNRFVILKMDESKEQTKRIIDFQTKLNSNGEFPFYSTAMLSVVEALKSFNVKIPFLDKISKVFPHNKISIRRLFNSFIDMIKAVTIVHQFQREKTADSKTLIAEWRDYDIAKDVFRNLCLGIPDIPLDERKASIIDYLKESEFMRSATEIHPNVKPSISLQALRPHLEALVNLHLLEEFPLKSESGTLIPKYKINEELFDSKPMVLPNSTELE